MVFESLRLGAAGFLEKTSSVRDIAAAVEAVASGRQVFSVDHRRVAHGELLALARRSGEAARLLGMLTQREVQILDLIVIGLTTRQMATRLGVSERTVSSHIGRLYGKLEVGTRVQAVNRALQMGLVDVKPDPSDSARTSPSRHGRAEDGAPWMRRAQPAT